MGLDWGPKITSHSRLISFVDRKEACDVDGSRPGLSSFSISRELGRSSGEAAAGILISFWNPKFLISRTLVHGSLPHFPTFSPGGGVLILQANHHPGFLLKSSRYHRIWMSSRNSSGFL